MSPDLHEFNRYKHIDLDTWRNNWYVTSMVLIELVIQQPEKFEQAVNKETLYWVNKIRSGEIKLNEITQSIFETAPIPNPLLHEYLRKNKNV